jgi:hypothetical protein
MGRVEQGLHILAALVLALGAVMRPTLGQCQEKSETYFFLPHIKKSDQVSTDPLAWSVRSELQTNNVVPLLPKELDPPLSAGAKKIWDTYFSDSPDTAVTTDTAGMFSVTPIDHQAVAEIMSHPQVAPLLAEGREYAEMLWKRRLEFYSNLEGRFNVSLDPAEHIRQSYAALLKYKKSVRERPNSEADAQQAATVDTKRRFGDSPGMWSRSDVKLYYKRRVAKHRLGTHTSYGSNLITEAEFDAWKKSMIVWVKENRVRQKLLEYAIEVDFANRPIYLRRYSLSGATLGYVRASPKDLMALGPETKSSGLGVADGSKILQLRSEGADSPFRYTVTSYIGQKYSSLPNIIPNTEWADFENPVLADDYNWRVEFQDLLKATGFPPDDFAPFIDLQHYLALLPASHDIAHDEYVRELQRGLKYSADSKQIEKAITTIPFRSLRTVERVERPLGKPVELPSDSFDGLNGIRWPDAIHVISKYWGLRQDITHWEQRKELLRNRGLLEHEVLPPPRKVHGEQMNRDWTDESHFGHRLDPYQEHGINENPSPKAIYNVSGEISPNEFFFHPDWNGDYKHDARNIVPKRKSTLLLKRGYVGIDSRTPHLPFQGIIAIPTPANGTLESFELTSNEGEPLELGKDYRIFQSKKDGSYFVELKTNIESVRFKNAIFSRRSRVEKIAKPPRMLRQLNADILFQVIEQMRSDGLDHIASALVRAIGTEKRVDIRALEAMLRDRTLYTYIRPAQNVKSEGLFTKYLKYFDASGRMCIQCGVASQLFADIINAYAKLNGDERLKARVQDGFSIKNIGVVNQDAYHARVIVDYNDQAIYLADVTPPQHDPRNPPSRVPVTVDATGRVRPATIASDSVEFRRAVTARRAVAVNRKNVSALLTQEPYPKKGFNPGERIRKALRLSTIVEEYLDGKIEFEKLESEVRELVVDTLSSNKKFEKFGDVLTAIHNWANQERARSVNLSQEALRKKDVSQKYRVYLDEGAQTRTRKLLESLSALTDHHPLTWLHVREASLRSAGCDPAQALRQLRLHAE